MFTTALDNPILPRRRRRDKMTPAEWRTSLQIDSVRILLEEGNSTERAFARPMLRSLEKRIPLTGRR